MRDPELRRDEELRQVRDQCEGEKRGRTISAGEQDCADGDEQQARGEHGQLHGALANGVGRGDRLTLRRAAGNDVQPECLRTEERQHQRDTRGHPPWNPARIRTVAPPPRHHRRGQEHEPAHARHMRGNPHRRRERVHHVRRATGLVAPRADQGKRRQQRASRHRECLGRTLPDRTHLDSVQMCHRLLLHSPTRGPNPGAMRRPFSETRAPLFLSPPNVEHCSHFHKSSARFLREFHARLAP